MEEYEKVSILLRKDEDVWSFSATPTKILGDRVVGNALGGGNGVFPTKGKVLAAAKISIDKWLFRH